MSFFWIIWLLLAIQTNNSLKCFTCSKHSGSKEKGCPSTSSSLSVWSQDSSSFYDVGSVSDYSCAIRVGGDGVIYHQGSIQKTSCNDSSVVSHIVSLVNTDSGTSGARYSNRK